MMAFSPSSDMSAGATGRSICSRLTKIRRPNAPTTTRTNSTGSGSFCRNCRILPRARIVIGSAGLGGCGQQLGPVLEVHRVVVIPGAAPDEAVPLEHPHDLDRDAVLPRRRV